MRGLALFIVCGLALAQPADPAYEVLARAYEALRGQDYETAIDAFLKAVAVAPRRAPIRKDLAYAYLKIGENLLAREQFREAMEIDPNDAQVALEYAFLCYETKERRQARRIFDRIRKTGDATAEQAFQNVDAPLAAGIERWKKAIEMGADTFSVHFELARLAEERDELELAATHYEKAWRLRPLQRSVLVDLGRAWKSMGRAAEANAALLAASRGGEPRAAESARELLPSRYPWVEEFRRALDLDPVNGDLRRELAFLLLKMGREGEAVAELKILTGIDPDDWLAATQLGFLLRARGDQGAAQPLFDRVLSGRNEELANRVRAVLRVPQALETNSRRTALDARLMAERSFKAGYMKDALRYLLIAHESDPGDFEVMLNLGWAYNILKQDGDAIRWFALASRAPDPRIAGDAAIALRNLRGSRRRIVTTAWTYPVFSSRFRVLFAYGQATAELRTPLPVRPYLSVRFVGDTRSGAGGVLPQYYSESSAIVGAGIRTKAWRGLSAWAEAGSAVSYLGRGARPDYRAGVSFARGVGRMLGSESAGWFSDTTLDGVFISRFGNDFLVYSQSRFGYTAGARSCQAQFYWNGNLTVDSRREAWANLAETGPGVRFASAAMPRGMYFTISMLQGSYLAGGKTRFHDVRAGIWYAVTH